VGRFANRDLQSFVSEDEFAAKFRDTVEPCLSEQKDVATSRAHRMRSKPGCKIDNFPGSRGGPLCK
jgi:hypothetical protein